MHIKKYKNVNGFWKLSKYQLKPVLILLEVKRESPIKDLKEKDLNLNFKYHIIYFKCIEIK